MKTLPSRKRSITYLLWENEKIIDSNMPPYLGAYGCFQKLGVPQNGWFIVEKPIKMDDLAVPLFSETYIC